MEFLTTITFRNDSASTLRENSEIVSEGIYLAQCGDNFIGKEGKRTFPVGSEANPVIIQKPRHADDTTLYMHAGNTVVDVFEAESDWAVDTFISEMEYHLKRLKKLKTERKKS